MTKENCVRGLNMNARLLLGYNITTCHLLFRMGSSEKGYMGMYLF